MAAEVVCQEYSSSLEDLTFNSKPLINMLTMLAEENSQHAAEIIKLIEKRIYEVPIDKKLPSLYLMDSIVKNIGNEYITAVTQCVVALFSHVFEKADEKVRMSLYKLRNTWPQYLSAKKLHEIDCSIHKLDPGWPVVDPPPASPSIHINPKFLPKVEEKVEEVKTISHEAKIVEDFERKKVELEKLQGEQMRLQLLQLEELKLKHDLIKKKQEQERQVLIKQQQERILQMRLQEEDIDATEIKPVDTKATETSTNDKEKSRDPRLEKSERNVIENTSTPLDKTNVKSEPIEEKSAPKSTESAVKKTTKKVGFDTEFVPLDSNSDDVELPPRTAYNRDRPLGKKRYFKNEPSELIVTTDNETEQTSIRVIVNDNEEKTKRIHENSKGSNKKGKRPRDDIVHRRDKARNASSISFQKEHKEDERKNEADGGTKGKSTSVRGRERNSRKHAGGRRDVDKEKRVRPRNTTAEANEEFHEGAQFARRVDWSKGRPHKRSRRGQPPDHERHGRNRHEFSPADDNPDNLLGRTGRKWGPESNNPFESGPAGEPLVKKARPSPPRPLFSEREISEIRERRRASPPPHGFGLPRDFDRRQYPPDWHNEEPGYDADFRDRWRHEEERAGMHPELFERPFPHGLPVELRAPRFPNPDDLAPPHQGFLPQRIPNEFHHHPNNFAGGVEIPLELTLDNEAEILRSAQRRLSTGDLSEEQHDELLEKLQQLYELQKWQRRHSLDIALQQEAEHSFLPRHPLHPPVELAPNVSLPGPEPSPGNQGFPNQPLETTVFGETVPGIFDLQPTREIIGGEERLPPPPERVDNRDPGSEHPGLEHPVVKDEVIAGPPSNLVMEKETVNDLFKRLMDFGIITKVNPAASESPGRVVTPPVEPEVKEIPIPEIKLTLDHLRRRYDGVILELYRGPQCSSCGLRFKETDNTHYRQHLDWHFRMNRKDKETTHRNWFITVDDWLEFESSEDPNLKARSSVFEVDSENSEEGVEGSCPVLREDAESEKACDICWEKFETFWDENSEDWHYKSAVRVDGKTYHYLCYHDAKETENIDDDGEASDEDDENENDGDCVNSESSSNNDKMSIVTENTESIVGGDVQPAVNDANKEEKKPECS